MFLEKIKINFLDGPYVEIMDVGLSEDFTVIFTDLDTNLVEFVINLKNGHWAKADKKYFLNWNIKIFKNDVLLVDYNLDLKNRPVLISLESSALGDSIAWFPYLDDFQKKHNCELVVTTYWNKLFDKRYPNITFKEPGQNLSNYFAWYRVGVYDGDTNRNKVDWRINPLQKISSDILGIDYVEKKPLLNYYGTPNENRFKRLISFSPNSTMQAKLWNLSDAWSNLNIKLNTILQYQMIQVGKEKNIVSGDNIIDGTTDSIFTTIDNIANSDFFIGLSSGLSWLAWTLGKKVVMISGFSGPMHEFQSDVIRIINKNVCNSCINKTEYIFDRGWDWCPAKNDFICTKKITVESVFNEILFLIQNKKIQ